MSGPIAPWSLACPDTALVEELAAALGVCSVTAACLVNRGICGRGEAATFLEPRLADLSSPDRMADLQRAAERLAQAVAEREVIGIFSDYDVDGVSSAALLCTFLRQCGTDAVVKLADRFSGYGMGTSAIDEFKAQRCSLIIALDCGTSDHEAARRALELGLDLIVVDHHRIEGANPNAFAFVNPSRKDCGFGDASLAAVGLAFYFAGAVRRALCQMGTIQRDAIDVRGLLDLVALGTVADVMPLRGNNRILVSHGLKVLSRSSREGLQSLIRVSRIRASRLRSEHIAFQLAPRLNAAGRISNANEAFNLLVSSGKQESDRLAIELDSLSSERRTVEDKVIEQARELADTAQARGDSVIIICGENWHRGVLGIVAARLTEQIGKPVLVIGFDGDVGTGSARGRGQINLHESLAACAEHLMRFGGHRDAAGFTLERERLPGFRAALLGYVDAHWIDVRKSELVCDGRISASEATCELLAELERLGPFGAGNPQPVLEVDGLYVLDKRVVGRDHLKLTLKTPTSTISAFGPRMGKWTNEIGPLVRVAANLIADDWRGEGHPELRLVAPPISGS